jgi:hypothetical protein
VAVQVLVAAVAVVRQVLGVSIQNMGVMAAAVWVYMDRAQMELEVLVATLLVALRVLEAHLGALDVNTVVDKAVKVGYMAEVLAAMIVMVQ